jgi:hypothetical protein
MKILPVTPAEVLELSGPMVAELREVFQDMEARAQSALSKGARDGLSPEALLDFVDSALKGPIDK